MDWLPWDPASLSTAWEMASLSESRGAYWYNEHHRVIDDPLIDTSKQTKVFVGPDKIEYRLSDGLLRKYSHHFAIVLALNLPDPMPEVDSASADASAEPATPLFGYAYLPSIEPRVFDHFYTWIKTGSLPIGLSVALTNGGSMLNVHIARTIQPQLVDLYVLAVKLQVPCLRAETLCAIHRCSRFNHAYAVPSHEVITKAFKQLHDTEPLCRYLTYAYIGLHDRTGVMLGQLGEHLDKQLKKLEEEQRQSQSHGQGVTTNLPPTITGPLARLPTVFSLRVRGMQCLLRPLPITPAYYPVETPQMEDIMLMRDGLVQDVAGNDMAIAMAYEAQGPDWNSTVGWSVLSELVRKCGGRLETVAGGWKV